MMKVALIGFTVGWVMSSIALAQVGLFNAGTASLGLLICAAWVAYAVARGAR